MELSEAVVAGTAPVGPKVFVSYAQESDEHKAQVLAFATFLRHAGIAAVLDLWSAAARHDWYPWAIREMTDADFVLVVASERYRMIGDGNGPSAEHRGVQSEAALLRELVYSDRATWLPKILPVVLPGHAIGQIPLFLQPHTASHFRVTSYDTIGAEELLRVILRQPGYLTPKVGTERLVLPPHAMQPPVAVRRPRLTGDLAQALEEFALEVRLRLQDENRPQQVLGPNPLAVGWKQAEGGLSDHVANIAALPDGVKAAQLDLVGQFDEIAAFYRRIPSGRLVILGKQGSGKTTLAIQLVIDTLSSREPADPVPVIVNIGSWNPASTDLREWLSGRLIQDYPALAATGPGGTVAKALVGTHHILPVFDGFDEIAGGLQGLAMSKLNHAGRPLITGLPLVLTSRPGDYRRAVDAGVLTAAAVVELDELTAKDLITYLLTQMLLGGSIVGIITGVGTRPIGDFIVRVLRHLVPQLVEGIYPIWGLYGIYVAVVDFLLGALGSAIAFCIVFTAWGHWLIFARFWLPLTGRLPWNLMAFLEDAYRRGVLRQPGPFYQFRHNLLQEHLASIEPREVWRRQAA